MRIIDEALAEGRKILSEHESKRVLSQFGIPVTPEALVNNPDDAKKAAQKIGFPVVLKGASPTLTHKTELGMVELGIKDDFDLEGAYRRIVSSHKAKCEQVLVQKMIHGERELIVGFTRDFQFGPCVMFGLGGIFAELFRDVTFRLPPLTEQDAMEMMGDIQGRKILGDFRGRSPVNKETLARILIIVGNIGTQYEVIHEIDINPLIVRQDGTVIAVDALIGLSPSASREKG